MSSADDHEDLKDRCMNDPFWAADEIERLLASKKELTSATAAVVEMANEIERLKTQAAEDIIWMSGIGPIPDEALAYWRQISDRWLGTKGKFSTDE